ncbi:MAG: hypothetical protein OEL76_01840 [Siculibacillus sp.]|nr:hypothetical protein [Siculibacillus sp.]
MRAAEVGRRAGPHARPVGEHPVGADPSHRHEVRHPEEAVDEGVDRPIEDRVGCADLPEPAGLVHDADAVGDGQRDLLIVGDVDHRDAELLLQLTDLEAHLLAQVGVEVVERLVEEEERRLGDQGAGECDALLLAAGELRGHARLEPREADLTDRPPRPPIAFIGAGAGDLERVGDVVGDAHVRPHRIVLEDHAEPAAVGGHVGPVARHQAVADPDRPGVGSLEPGEEPHQHRLAASRRSEQREALARLHRQIQAMEYLSAPI